MDIDHWDNDDLESVLYVFHIVSPFIALRYQIPLAEDFTNGFNAIYPEDDSNVSSEGFQFVDELCRRVHCQYACESHVSADK
jgi:hypothetical protein